MTRPSESTRFNVTTAGQFEEFRQLCEQHVNQLWIAAHLTDAQAERFAVEHLRKWVAGELEMILALAFRAPAASCFAWFLSLLPYPSCCAVAAADASQC